MASLEDPLFFFFEIYLCTAPDRDCREREREGGGGQVEIERNYHSEKEKGLNIKGGDKTQIIAVRFA